ncbi:mammalian cell entry protein [Mycolicibacterium arenosum]|uniref:Mammalian cell entry protein n=1 Tax=Mycolicibacterium arenosum TaxID=2952157 RepID=A0ABT1M1U7_9MYCO|nr:mammalian cell entry protein [Mycolicibacterium sp. CAU 1645]MCP9272432.1 mammalian cell entry protein [Mycolicibacterium sp. CAU 1645]
MEDQQPDSGDLTDDSSQPDALVPEGKSGRRKHRVPRSKLLQQADEGVDPEPTPDEPVADAEVEAAEAEAAEVEAAEAEAAEVETPEVEVAPEAETEPTPEPAPKLRRLPWRRSAPAAVVEEPVVEEPVVEEPAAEEPAAEEPEPEPILVPHSTAPRGLKIAAAVAAALVVAAAAFAGAMLQPYLSQRADVQIKQNVAETAAAAITSLWTYTPDDIDQLADRTARYLGGDFAAQYRTFIDSIAEANKQAQVTNQTQVVGAAVESLTPTEATAIVYTNSVSTTPSSQGFQSMRYLSYRLTLENRDRKWLITKMNDITSLDLTPQL